MLGLADRAGTLDLFELVLKGDPGGAVGAFRHLYALADPAQVVLDLMEHVHGRLRRQGGGPQALILPKDQTARLAARAGAAVSAPILARLWQMLLRAHDEVGRAPDPAAATDMALIRLSHAADLARSGGGAEAPEERREPRRRRSYRRRRRERGLPAARRAPCRPRPHCIRRHRRRPARVRSLQTFEHLVALIEAERDIALKLDVERLRPARSASGPGSWRSNRRAAAPANLAQRLVRPPQGLDRPGLAGGGPGRRRGGEPLGTPGPSRAARRARRSARTPSSCPCSRPSPGPRSWTSRQPAAAGARPGGRPWGRGDGILGSIDIQGSRVAPLRGPAEAQSGASSVTRHGTGRIPTRPEGWRPWRSEPIARPI
jgi:hypothetical protein